MFAMWTTFYFGPRILARDRPGIAPARRKLWTAFAVSAAALTAAKGLECE
jgi:hypothetical protein